MTPKNSIAAGNTDQSNSPFIWGHIAIIAGVPWLLSLTMAGLAVGDPVFPAWFEIFVLGFPAIALTTWVQWQQPLSPFSLWFVAKPIESLSDRDRRVLTLIKQQRNGWYVTGWIAIAVAILMSCIFCKIYDAAPLAQAIAPFPNWLRFLGIVWAEFFFLLSNVLLQSGISALRIKLTTESELLSLQPLAIEKIKNSFTNIGLRSAELLKFFEDELVSENLVSENLVSENLVSENLVSENVTDSTISAPKIEEPVIDDDMDELNAFNIYVENILQEYLEEPVEEVESENTEPVTVENILQDNLEEPVESENIFQDNLEEPVESENILQDNLEEHVENKEFENKEVADIANVTVISATEMMIVEEFLVTETISSESILETITLSSMVEIDIEAIAEVNISINEETIVDNFPSIKTQAIEEIFEEISMIQTKEEQKDVDPKACKPKSPKYLVEEFLVDKYLAKLEELNNVQKTNKSPIQTPEFTDSSSTESNSTDPVADEFADLDALIDRKPFSE